MEELKKLILNKKVLLAVATVVLLLIASFLIYVFVFAEDEDPYANYFRVDMGAVSVEDGLEDFDSTDDGDGNDKLNDNHKVRTFDSVKYKVSYNLRIKTAEEKEESQTLTPGNDSLRMIAIDVLVPTSISVKNVCLNGPDQDCFYKQQDDNGVIVVGPEDGTKYVYYRYETGGGLQRTMPLGNGDFSIFLTQIYGDNNTTFKPIIRISEATDTGAIKIERTTPIEDIVGADLGDNIVLTARDAYALKLYQGSKGETTGNKTPMTFGVIAYLPSYGAKGYKGLHVPSAINTNIVLTANVENSVSSDPSIVPYAGGIDTMPNAPDVNVHSQLGTPTTSGAVTTIPVTITDMEYDSSRIEHIANDASEDNYFASRLVTFNSVRNTGVRDITYKVEMTGAINRIEDYKNNYVPFVGDYTSSVKFFIDATSSTGSTNNETGPKYENIINYNEDFYIENEINYGKSEGDTLTNGFTHYIKIDSDAIKISETTLDEFPVISKTDSNGVTTRVNVNIDGGKETIEFGYGTWNSASFQLNDGAPSYCVLTNATKPQLMDEFGGPCLKTNVGITWASSIQDIPAEQRGNIIAIRYTESDEYPNATKTIIKLSAKAKKDTNNIGNAYTVVSRGVTTWNNQAYYLSQKSNGSRGNLTYSATTYDASGNVTLDHTSTADGETVDPVGGTIYISPFKAFINPIDVFDAYDSKKDTIYAGVSDPVEFQINPVIYKSDADADILEATVDVYLPKTLEIYQRPGDKAWASSTSNNDYNIYTYKYTTKDIMFKNKTTGENSTSGTIDTLLVHAYVSPDLRNTQPAVVKAVISGKLKPRTPATAPTYTDKTPVAARTQTKEITLENPTPINNIGKTNVLRIDKNGSYEYTVRAFNNNDSGSAELSLLYIIPYKDDGYGSNMSGSTAVSMVGSLPAGYTAYYTTDDPKTLITSMVNDPSSINWQPYSNVNTPLSNATAIKISAAAISAKNYFGPDGGFKFKIDTRGNKELDKYLNAFYMVQNNAVVCEDVDEHDQCTRTAIKPVAYMSNISEVSVYNRTITGYVFEDENYNGFYDNGEPRLKDVSVDLYRLTATIEDADQKYNPASIISDSDELVSDNEITTNYRGYYKFSSISSGNYYVKYRFNCDKYTVTDKNKEDPTRQGDTTLIDSDAQIIEKEEIVDEETGEKKNVCYAVSNILTLDNNKVEYNHIDLGLKVREDFDIGIKKYITNVKVISNGNVVQDNNYDNQSKVKVDVKNFRNTSFKVTYGIEIENTKYFPGTIGTIVETIPAGMTFNPNYIENDGWYEYNGRLYYNNMNKTLIMPGEKYRIKIVLDLVTDTGGDYINIVAAGNLRIKSAITDFLDVPEDEVIIPIDTGRESYEEDDDYYYYDDEEYYDFDVDYPDDPQYDPETDEGDEWEDE